MWLGSVTFDRDVGFSRYTGQITHHIAPDIDAERNGLTNDLRMAKVVEAIYEVTGVGPTLLAWNGGGDRYYTDGEIKIALSSFPAATPQPKPPSSWKIRRSSISRTRRGRQSLARSN